MLTLMVVSSLMRLWASSYNCSAERLARRACKDGNWDWEQHRLSGNTCYLSMLWIIRMISGRVSPVRSCRGFPQARRWSIGSSCCKWPADPSSRPIAWTSRRSGLGAPEETRTNLKLRNFWMFARFNNFCLRTYGQLERLFLDRLLELEVVLVGDIEGQFEFGDGHLRNTRIYLFGKKCFGVELLTLRFQGYPIPKMRLCSNFLKIILKDYYH